jgi:hypothetical protein
MTHKQYRATIAKFRFKPRGLIWLLVIACIASAGNATSSIAQIPDHHIKALVGVYGPESREENDRLANTVIARRDAVARAYGIKKEEYQEGAGRATIAFHEFESGGAFDC